MVFAKKAINRAFRPAVKGLLAPDGVSGGRSYLAETLAYQARVEAEGGTMTADGLALVDALFANAESQSITLSRGYLFGTSVNLPASNRKVLELTGDGQALTADAASAGSVITCGKGSLCLEGTTAQQGKLFTSSEALFNNEDWTQLCYYQKPLYNPNDAATASFYASQYNTFASGRFWILGSQTGGLTVQPLSGGTAINHRATNYGGGGLIEPIVFFLTYNATTRALTAYNPHTKTSIGTGAMPADFTILPTHFGAAQIASAAAGRPQQNMYLSHLKYAGVLTTAQMDSIWSTFKPLHDELVDIAWIIGNSVTSGADAAEAAVNTARNWPQLFSQSAARNNCLTLRPLSMGGKDIDYFRPSDLTQNPNSTVPAFSPYTAADSVDTWKAWRPTILVCDENQNTAANSSVNADYEYDYTWVIDAIVADLREIRSDLKVVCGTQMAVGPDGKSYATIIAEETSVPSIWRRNLRDWSALIRADEGARFDAVYDVYADFNLGWDVGDDGDAADPVNDYPNGDPSLFYDDHQHPNAAGHALMATGYWDAVASVKLR